MTYIHIGNPDTGETHEILSTPEIRGIASKHWAYTCPCSQTEVRVRTYENGSKHYVKQCLQCGRQVSNVKKDTVQNYQQLSFFDEDLSQHFQNRRNKEFYYNMLPFISEQSKHLSERSLKYQEYLNGNKWKEKRQKVFKRAGYTCEGCLEKPASQVHHLSYDHIFEELLYELVAICDDCHEIAHKKTDFKMNSEIGSTAYRASELDFEECDFDESFCGTTCRWVSYDAQGNELCGIHEVPTEFALKDVDLCGPEKKSFEGLK